MNNDEYLNEKLSYVKFLLIGDTFYVSYKLRNMRDWGMDELYNVCDTIAKAFCYYDEQSKNIEHYSLYDSLEKFLKEYNEDILLYIDGGIDNFHLLETVRSNYE